MMGFGLVIVAIFIAVGLYIVGWQSIKQTTARHTALDILKQRYASGEISQEEYRTMRQDLS